MADEPTMTSLGKIESFSEFLRTFRDGAVDVELTEAVREATVRAQITGKAASVVYTLKLEPTGSALMVEDKVVVKLPDLPREGGIFYPAKDGMLSFDPPSQPPLSIQGEDLDVTISAPGRQPIETNTRVLRSVADRLNAGEMRD